MDKYKNALQAVKPKKTVQEKPENKNQRGGKRSDPKYRPTTVFVLAEAHEEVSHFLIGNKEMDFSDFVNSLLVEWMAKRKTGKQ